MDQMQIVLDRLERIEAVLVLLTEQQTAKEWYATDELAHPRQGRVHRGEWCRQGRICAEKRISGRGAFAAWVVSHDRAFAVSAGRIATLARQCCGMICPLS